MKPATTSFLNESNRIFFKILFCPLRPRLLYIKKESRVKVMSKIRKLLLITIILILITGCININVTPQSSGQNTTPEPASNFIKTSKNIDTSKLDIQKVILNNTEMKEILGKDWNLKGTETREVWSVKAYEKQNTYYKEPPTTSIIVFILPNITSAKQLYDKPFPDFKLNPTGNINLGDSGKIFQTENGFMIIFRINTIIVMTSTSTDLDIATKIAKKQEAKINNILQSIY